MKTIAQAALYPLYKQEIPNSLRLEFLSSVRSLIQQGNIFDEVPIYRLITPDIEVSLSPIGCCELYGDFNSFFDLLPIILRVSKRLNLFYNWVFIDPVKSTATNLQKRAYLIQSLQNQKDFDSVIFGSSMT